MLIYWYMNAHSKLFNLNFQIEDINKSLVVKFKLWIILMAQVQERTPSLTSLPL